MDRSQSTPAPHRPTMNDVARAAGVSAMTVSNVINSRTDRVSPDTIDRVVRVIDELGYRLNPAARSLRQGRTGMVGLGLPLLNSEYYGEVAQRLSLRFGDHGLRLVIENTGGMIAAEVESLDASRLETYDGFVLAVAGSESADLSLLRPTKPIVLLGERAISTPFDHVLMDNVGGAETAVGYMLDRGARRVLALGGSLEGGTSMQTLRTKGYVDAHRARNATISKQLIVPSGLDAAGGYATISSSIDQGLDFDAIFAFTDVAAIGALRALADHGRSVPADVQVCGFNNITTSGFTSPRLTTVEPSNEAMAEEVVRLMMSRLRSFSEVPTQRTIRTVSARLVRRDSTL